MIYSRNIKVFKYHCAHYAHISLSFGCTDETMDYGVHLHTFDNMSAFQNFKIWKSESCNMHGSIAHISNKSGLGKSRNIILLAPHSYRLGRVIYIRVRGFPWTGYLVPVRVCLPVAVGHGGCWLAAVVGVILYRYHFGDLKSTQIDKIHKIHAPKFQGRVFSEVAEAPQADTTHRTARGGP